MHGKRNNERKADHHHVACGQLKISHVNPNVVTALLKYLERIYGKLRITCGKKHEYLGMEFDYSVPGKVRVSMEKYTLGVISEFPEKIDKVALTPAGEHLFQVQNEKERERLPKEQAQAFHQTVAQLLFLTARPRRDIRTAVAFLTTQVKDPDMDNWGNLFEYYGIYEEIRVYL